MEIKVSLIVFALFIAGCMYIPEKTSNGWISKHQVGSYDTADHCIYIVLGYIPCPYPDENDTCYTWLQHSNRCRIHDEARKEYKDSVKKAVKPALKDSIQ